MGSIFYGGFSLLARKSVSIRQPHFSKTVATRRAASIIWIWQRSFINGNGVKADNDAARRIVSHGFLPRPWYAQGGGGRGNLRVAKTPPLQSAFAGMPLRVALRSRCCHCRRLHARAMPPMENHVFITEAEWEGRALLGVCGYAGVGGQLSARPYSTAPTQNAIENLANG